MFILIDGLKKSLKSIFSLWCHTPTAHLICSCSQRWGNICLSRFSVSESWCTLKAYSSVNSEDANKQINSSSFLFCCLPVLFTVSTNAVFCWYQVSLCESSQKLGGLFNQPSGWHNHGVIPHTLGHPKPLLAEVRILLTNWKAGGDCCWQRSLWSPQLTAE